RRRCGGVTPVSAQAYGRDRADDPRSTRLGAGRTPARHRPRADPLPPDRAEGSCHVRGDEPRTRPAGPYDTTSPSQGEDMVQGTQQAQSRAGRTGDARPAPSVTPADVRPTPRDRGGVRVEA